MASSSTLIGIDTPVNLDTAFWTTFAIIALLLVLSAFFSGSETALTAASRGKLRAMADKGQRGAKRALRLTDESERLIGAVLLGNNLVNILAAAIATSLFTRLFGDSGVALATLIMTVLVLIFAEVLPKTYAITNPESAASRVAVPIRLIVTLFAPIVGFIQLMVNALLRLLGNRRTLENATDTAQDEIAGAIALGHSEGTFEKEDRDRLLGALDLKDREVHEIMLHRSDIEMIDANDTPQEILDKALQSRYTRLPVFCKTQENIIGVLHAKELLRHVNGFLPQKNQDIKDLDVNDVLSTPYFVPETTPLADQMREFLRQKRHFALVVDEYGDLQGLITLEDILEEIVGEITDEFDVADADTQLCVNAEGYVVVDGAMTIRDFNRAQDWKLPDEEANTIAGLVIHCAQMIPEVGQIFNFYDFQFEILERDGNRITKLNIRAPQKSQN